MAVPVGMTAVTPGRLKTPTSSSTMCPWSWINSPSNAKNLPLKWGVCRCGHFAILPFCTEGVQAILVSRRDGEREQLIRCPRSNHIVEVAGVSVGDTVIEIVKEGCHQGIPISSCGVFGSFYEERRAMRDLLAQVQAEVALQQEGQPCWWSDFRGVPSKHWPSVRCSYNV